jgi:hypothetical protein
MPDPENVAAVLRLMRDELMALFIAEVRDIYDGSGVGGNELQRVAGFEALQPLARFQHWQRAEQPLGIEFVFHGRTSYSVSDYPKTGLHGRVKPGHKPFGPIL